MVASAIFIAGPPAATQAMSRRELRKAANFTGTGLAYPKTNGDRASKRNPGSRIVPTGSMCLKGLRLTRPNWDAVSSPRNRATNACAASCNVMASYNGNHPYGCDVERVWHANYLGAFV